MHIEHVYASLHINIDVDQQHRDRKSIADRPNFVNFDQF